MSHRDPISEDLLVFFSCPFPWPKGDVHTTFGKGLAALQHLTVFRSNWLQQDCNVLVTSLLWQPRWWKTSCISFLLHFCFPLFLFSSPLLHTCQLLPTQTRYFYFKYTFTTVRAQDAIKHAYVLYYPGHSCFIQHLDNRHFRIQSSIWKLHIYCKWDFKLFKCTTKHQRLSDYG